MGNKNRRLGYGVKRGAGRSCRGKKHGHVSPEKAITELQKTVSELRESVTWTSKYDRELAEKEHFRPFIEARIGHPISLDNIWKHTRLDTWVAKEELLAEIKAVIADIENKSGFDLTALLSWWDSDDPGSPSTEDPADELDLSSYKTTSNPFGSGKIWSFEKYGGSIRNLEYIDSPNEIVPYAAVCKFFGKEPHEIEWEEQDRGEKRYDYWHNFVLIVEGKYVKVANLRLANVRMREMREVARDAGKEFYWDIRTSCHYDRMNENYLRYIDGRWIRHYVTSTLYDTPLETADLTKYVSYIPVDFFGDVPYNFDYTPWNKLFDGRNSSIVMPYAAPVSANGNMTANRKKTNTKKNIVVTARGHDATIDKLTVCLVDEDGDNPDSNARKYCDAVNRLGYKLKDTWVYARIVRDNVPFEAASFVFPDLDMLRNFSDRDLQMVLSQDEIESADLAKVLKARPELKDKIYRNMAKKDSLMLEEDIEYMGPIPRARIAESEEKIKAVMRRLDSEGKINFAYADDIVE